MACSRCGATIRSTLSGGRNVASPATVSPTTAPIVNRAALPPLLTRLRSAAPVEETVTPRRAPRTKAKTEDVTDG